MTTDINIRLATPEDVPTILAFIQGLAEYEKLADQVVATEDKLKHTLFGDKRYAEVVIAEYNQQAAGFALFFHNYSTFLAKPGIYLEDLFVLPDFRGKGLGKVLLSYLAKLAVERDCGRLEWSVLDWNQPAIDFYQAQGATMLHDWRINRVTGENLKALAQSV
ncbi:MAG: N-acetyltransferase [Alteromonadaceae bacterium]|jgi:GNAT superfamily N-acetyltransferase|uniref:GNAT family N-acetyltransferase n=1 Tax=Rheinheimera TaxID=67575 RepID=UPI000C457ED6|nr:MULTISPECIES: GNAT family N-acetyltransferase [Rheinheimera]MBJ91418.1 N-acetyltransferase [Alteromonadaceae bacterium]MCD1598297.1 GNAT family N-acetyltransferase [Rheinheimera aquimaris]HBN88165.1 N-acetyltransferase [Rheinheimera sp.]|tara:strand:+ start:3049 stop:3537 length:489 start_codon:yes stop_codon:yes gene_type:complete